MSTPMTDSLSPRLAFAAVTTGSKARAFRAARRHSLLVKTLRGLLFAGAVVLLPGILIVKIADPFHAVPGVSVEGGSVDGTKITMAHPKLAGYHNDGRPYEITASSAVQDIKVPNLFELHDMDAHLTMLDKTTTHVTAASGNYDSKRETLALTSQVRISSDSGLDMRTEDAHVEFKSETLATDKPVSVAMRGNTIEADAMRMTGGGKQVTFEGHVRTVLLPGSDATVVSPAATLATAP